MVRFLLYSFLLTLVKALNDPKCVFVKFKGLSGDFELIEVGNTNNPSGPTKGDVIISGPLSPTTADFPQKAIVGDKFKVMEFEAKAICRVLQDGSSAPSCKLEVTAIMCATWEGACVTWNDGTFIAEGTGPAKYAITGGTGGFLGAFGEFDAEFDSTSGTLNNVEIKVCAWSF